MALRIVHVISSDAGIGGGEAVVAELCRYGAAMGWDQVVLRPFGRNETASALRRLCDPVPVMSGGRHRRDPFSVVQAMWWINHITRRFGPEVVHAHLFHAAVVVAALPSQGAVKLLSHHHGRALLDLGRRREARVDRWAVSRFDHVVGVSVAVSEFLAAEYDIPSHRVSTVRNGWSGSPLPPAPVPGRIVAVGRLRPEKGHDVLVRAIATVVRSAPSAHLVLVGDGPMRSNLQDLARRLGVDNRVEFAGHTDDVWSYLKDAAVFVQPSRSEPLGIAVLEAMAAGVPVVATTVGGLPELVTAETGALVPPCDVEAMASQIVRYLSSPEEALAAGERGRRVAGVHTAAEMAMGYGNLYASLVSRKAPTPAQ